MKFLMRLVMLISVLILSGSLYAADKTKVPATSSAINYAVVDYNYVVQNSKAFKDFTTKKTKNENAIKAAAESDKTYLETTRNTLVQNGASYTQEDYQNQQDDFKKKVALFQKTYAEKEQEFKQVNVAALKAVEDALSKVISEKATVGKYDLIYRAAGLAAYPQNRNITQDILVTLDKRMSSVKLENISVKNLFE